MAQSVARPTVGPAAVPEKLPIGAIAPWAVFFGILMLVLTCTGDLSRNRRLGLALGKGIPLQEAIRQIGQVVESVVTADEVDRLAVAHGLDLPISAAVRDVLHGKVTPEEGVRRLMGREQKAEYPVDLFAGRRG